MIYKRGKVYWYKFMWQGRLVRESTKQKNDKVARQMEAAHRTSLAKGEVGIREKNVAPKLLEFCEERFEPWAKATFAENARKSWLWYRTGIRALLFLKTARGSCTRRNNRRDRLGVCFSSSWKESANFHSEQFSAGLEEYLAPRR